MADTHNTNSMAADISAILNILQANKNSTPPSSDELRSSFDRFATDYASCINTKSRMHRPISSYIKEIKRLPEYNADGKYDIIVTDTLLSLFAELLDKIKCGDFTSTNSSLL